MPTHAELQRLLTIPNESLAVEYKSWLTLADNPGRATLAKAAIALANHDGGIIVLGMRPDNAEGGALGSQLRPDGLRRYSQDDVNAAINRFADPAFHCDLMFAVHAETGVEHAFVIVPGGMKVPVMSTRDCDRVIAARRCYIRKPGPRSEEPITGEEWRALLDRCVKAGRDDMLEAIRTIVQGRAGITPSAEARNALVEFVETGRRRWQTLIDPLPQDDPARLLLGYREFGFELLGVAASPTLIELRRRIDVANEVRLTGWHPFLSLDREPFRPQAINGKVETWLGAPEDERVFHDAAHCDFWRASPSGKFMMIRGYSEDAWEGVAPGTTIDVTNPVWRIGETLLFASRVARQYGANPSIVARCRCTGLNGRTLISINGRRHMRGDRRCVDDEVTLETEATAAQIEDNLAELLHSFLAPLYERFAFFELPMELVVEEVAALRRGRF